MLFHSVHRNEVVAKNTSREGKRFGIDCSPVSPDHTDRGIKARRIDDNFGDADRIIASVLQTGANIDGVSIQGMSPAQIMAAADAVPKPNVKKYKLFL
jgi:hypothetical protein